MVEFNFRGIPQRMSGQQSHYVFGGRTEVSFKAYALNEDELDKLNEETKKSDIGDVLKLIEGTTTESLEQLQKEIDSFIKEKPEEEKSEEKAGDTNPFMALIGKYEGETKQESKKEEKKEKKTIGEKIKTFFVGEKKKTEKKEKEIQPDNFIEAEHQRSAAQASAVKTVFDLFDMYKKVHGMSSYT